MMLVQLKAEKGGVFLPLLFAQGPGSRSLKSRKTILTATKAA